MQVQQLNYVFLRGEAAYLNLDEYRKATGVVNAVAFTASSGRVGDVYIRENAFRETLHVNGRSVDIVGYVKRWSDLFRLEDASTMQRETMFLPAQGWIDDVWYDGPLIHIDAAGNVVNAIAEGLPFALTIDGMSAENARCDIEAFNRQRDTSRLTSLVHAMTLKIGEPHDRVLMLDIESFNVSDILNIVVLRKAYPDHVVYLRHETPYKNWSSGFKRLCQNLGIAMYDTEEPQNTLLVPSALLAKQTSGYELQLLQAASLVSAIVPPQLLRI